jgi:hypothetical protein
MLREMNKELAAQGYITMSGKIQKAYWAKEAEYLPEHDLYYPDLELPEGADYPIGKYGHMRWQYLKEHSHGQYMHLLFSGKLNEYLHEIDEECHDMMDRLVEQMKPGAGITEELKSTDQMKWGGLMNNVLSAAEEIVLKEIIYV